MKIIPYFVLLLIPVGLCTWLPGARAATIPLADLDLSAMSAGWGTAQKNLSITKVPLGIGGGCVLRKLDALRVEALTRKLSGPDSNFARVVFPRYHTETLYNLEL